MSRETRRYWAGRYLRDLLTMAVLAGVFTIVWILLSLAIHGKVKL